MEKKNLTLKKEQIDAIKYFIRQEEKVHEYGDWDKFKISYIRIHDNGYYAFNIHWNHKIDNIFDDYSVEGNLFDEFPIYSVLDCLDAVHLLFYKIHIKAYNRAKEYADKMIKQNNEQYEYLKKIYEPGGVYNKEGKILNI